VRGFGGDFNETLYDGRRISTAAGGRSVDFSTVGADFVGSLTVMKTPDVTLSSSSIGATVNIAFPKPLDSPGTRFVASAAASEQEENGNIQPSGGVLFSTTFAEDSMGFLADAIYTKRDTDTNRVFVSGWEGGKFAPCQLTAICNPGDLDDADKTIVGWWQQQYGAEQSQVSDERIDGRIAFQWRPSDSTLLTIDDNFSRQKIETNTYGFGLWFGLNDLRSVQLDGNGTVTDFRQAGTPMDLNGGTENRERRTNQVGVNLQHSFSDNLSIDADVSYAKSEQNPSGGGFDGADIGYGGALGFNMGVQVLGDSSDHIPQMTTYGPNGDQSRYLDPSIIGSHVLVRTLQENSDTIKQARFKVSWQQENVKVDAGLSWVDDNFTLQGSNTFANNYWQAYGGYGAPSGRTSGVVVPSSIYRGTIGTSGFIPGFSGTGSLPPGLLVYSPYDLYGFLGGLGNPWQQQINGFNYPGPDPNPTNAPGTLANSQARCAAPGAPSLCNFTGTLDLQQDAGSIQDITERTWALFLAAKFDTELGSMPFPRDGGYPAREDGCVFERRWPAAHAAAGQQPGPDVAHHDVLGSAAHHHRQRLRAPAAQHRHEAGADGRVAPAFRCLAHADPAADQLPDAGTQRGQHPAHRRTDGHGRQPGTEALSLRQPRPRGRVVLRQERVPVGGCVREGRDQLHRAGYAAPDHQ
jgi:TonB-dependent receptor